jgi:hypothetical protein
MLRISRESNSLPEFWRVMESECRGDRSRRLVAMVVGEKAGM